MKSKKDYRKNSNKLIENFFYEKTIDLENSLLLSFKRWIDKIIKKVLLNTN
jgi:hypothetical protein